MISEILEELYQTTKLAPLWTFWSWLDIRQRYRRSLLGPFWVSLTMGVSVLAIGLVYTYLFKQDIAAYLPYVAAGFVVWSLISGFVGEACLVYIQNEGYIMQIKLPYLLYPVRLLWRYLIVFSHHSLVLIVVLAIFTNVSPGAALSALVGLLLVSANLLWIGIVLGILSVRLRDVPVLISTVFQVMFLITPVIWPAEALGDRMLIATYNPFYHYLEAVRGPLLQPDLPIWNDHAIFSSITGFFGLLLALVWLVRSKKRLALLL